MNLQTLLAKYCIKSCLTAVGLERSACPKIFLKEKYSPPREPVNVEHITINGNIITMHSYSTDMRERHRSIQFESFVQYLRYFIKEKINSFSISYMAAFNKEKIDCFKEGNFDDFFSELNRAKNVLQKNADRYMNSIQYRVAKAFL